MKLGKEVVLLYNLDNEKGKRIKTILVQMGVRIKNITKEMYTQKVGFLAGIKEFEKKEENYQGEEFLDELIILKGFSDKRLEFLLNELRRHNAKVDLKAVITQQNQNWNSLELYEELRKEHNIMQSK